MEIERKEEIEVQIFAQSVGGGDPVLHDMILLGPILTKSTARSTTSIDAWESCFLSKILCHTSQPI